MIDGSPGMCPGHPSPPAAPASQGRRKKPGDSDAMKHCVAVTHTPRRPSRQWSDPAARRPARRQSPSHRHQQATSRTFSGRWARLFGMSTVVAPQLERHETQNTADLDLQQISSLVAAGASLATSRREYSAVPLPDRAAMRRAGCGARLSLAAICPICGAGPTRCRSVRGARQSSWPCGRGL